MLCVTTVSLSDSMHRQFSFLLLGPSAASQSVLNCCQAPKVPLRVLVSPHPSPGHYAREKTLSNNPDALLKIGSVNPATHTGGMRREHEGRNQGDVSREAKDSQCASKARGEDQSTLMPGAHLADTPTADARLQSYQSKLPQSNPTSLWGLSDGSQRKQTHPSVM